jgi:chorismate-pyruvate lyase
MATATDANKFELDPESTVMHRAVFLRGRTTARNFVFALSQIAIGHLPEAVRRQLQETSDPIGRVLFDNGIDVGRKTILGPIDSSDVAEHPRTQISKAVLARRYLIVVGERPTFDVREWFLPSTLDALAATGDAHPNRRSPA